MAKDLSESDAGLTPSCSYEVPIVRSSLTLNRQETGCLFWEDVPGFLSVGAEAVPNFRALHTAPQQQISTRRALRATFP